MTQLQALVFRCFFGMAFWNTLVNQNKKYDENANKCNDHTGNNSIVVM
jgi:hypothetical protein